VFRLGETCCAVVREEKYLQNVDPKIKIVSTNRLGLEINTKTDLTEERTMCMELDSSGSEYRCAACVCETKSEACCFM
jgi:hypothetical protein